MRYFATIEVEIEAESKDEAEEVADEIAQTIKDQHIFEAIDSFVTYVQ